MRVQRARSQTRLSADLVCAHVTASACTRRLARVCASVRVHVRAYVLVCARLCVCVRACVCGARSRLPPRARGALAPARAVQPSRTSCFYRNRGAAAPPAEASAGACPVEAASLAQVWVSSKWRAGLRRHPHELNPESLCAVGGGGAARPAAPPGEPQQEPCWRA